MLERMSWSGNATLASSRENSDKKVIGGGVSTHVHSAQSVIKKVSIAPVELIRVVILLSEIENRREKVITRLTEMNFGNIFLDSTPNETSLDLI